ncbi:putative ankyrin repeat protein RF_0381 isoform X2 [Solenopsis invicta]|uniref:putative ankyrin repeat protein RF_0381 isoform X2 n=1 Tax=Solenopsis invicta TaxID=13686 RepID=UPI00193CD3B3|nr:putative ankyrin repeat protein RF_0381 isoform X2 [Solenopsis invicta]
MENDDANHIALILTIKNGKFDDASKILECDDENKYVGPLGVLQVTALQMAAWQGNIDLLNQLCERGADINSKDKIGRCALYYAAYNGNTEVIKWLLEHGAHIDIKMYSCTEDIGSDEYRIRYNPYAYHLRLTNSSLVGRQLPVPTCWGRTPLHQAVENNHADVVRVLVEGGADVNVKDENQITPLFLAGISVNRDNLNEMIKFLEIVGILVAAKASVNAFPNSSITGLHVRVMLRSAAATKILLLNGVWPLKNSGSMLLHIAARIGNIETLTILLEAMSPEFDIDIPDEENHTALHIAVYQGHRECAHTLISRGANLAAVTNTRATAVDAIFDYIWQPLDFLTDVLNSCVTTGKYYRIKKKYIYKIRRKWQ